MFGYVRPCKPELKIREYESFRAMYCGLCHTLRDRYGVGTRFMLSYDMCFVALMMTSAFDCGIKTSGRRCMVSPLRKRNCVRANAALEYAADCSVILMYWKLRDGIKDERGLKKLGTRLLSVLIRRKYKKAAAYKPEFADAVENGIKSLDGIEQVGTLSIDRAANAFANMMMHIASGLEDERVRRPYEQVFYHVGRWVYIMDAWDDLEDDIKSGRFNAIAARYDVGTDEGRENAREAVRLTLAHSAETAAAAAELIDLGRSDTLVKNILYMGLSSMTDEVLAGMTKQRRRGHGSI